MKTVNSFTYSVLSAALVLALLPINNAESADRTSVNTPVLQTVVTPSISDDSSNRIRVLARKMIDNVIPAFDEKLLNVKPADDWTGGLGFDKLTNAMGDGSVRLADKLLQSQRVSDTNRSLKIISERGLIRYENHARTWDFNQGPKLRITTEQAKPVFVKALKNLGLPDAEFGDMRIDTQMMRYSENAKDPKNFGDEYEMYHLIKLNRKLNGLPVLHSRALATINNDGLVQRLKVSWKPFKLNSRLKMLSREQVLDNVVDEVLQDDPLHITDNPDVKIFASLAYADQLGNTEDGKDETSAPQTQGFQPVVVVSVLAMPTPYQVVVPLAEEVN